MHNLHAFESTKTMVFKIICTFVLSGEDLKILSDGSSSPKRFDLCWGPQVDSRSSLKSIVRPGGASVLKEETFKTLCESMYSQCMC